MMRSPRSASATSNARSLSGGISSVSTLPSAWPSTSATRPDSWPTSAENCPGPWSMMWVTWPSPSRWLMVTLPDSSTNMPGPGLPASKQRLVVLVMPDVAEPPQAIDLVRRQRRKGLLVSCKGSCAARPGHVTDICHLATHLPQSDASLPPSSREAVRPAEDVPAPSLRPRACDLRRFRFSRNASFRRSCRDAFPELAAPALSLSFCIAGFCLASWPCRGGGNMAPRPPAMQSLGIIREPASRHRPGRRGATVEIGPFCGLSPWLPRACAHGVLVARTARPQPPLRPILLVSGHAAVAQW